MTNYGKILYNIINVALVVPDWILTRIKEKET